MATSLLDKTSVSQLLQKYYHHHDKQIVDLLAKLEMLLWVNGECTGRGLHATKKCTLRGTKKKNVVVFQVLLQRYVK